VIGEGGSGGALGIAVGDRLCIMQNAYLSVISPEGCASILWRNSEYAQKAAQALKLTAPELLEFGIVDDIVSEPLGGAHRDPRAAAENLKAFIIRHLDEICAAPLDELVEQRYQKFRRIGIFEDALPR
jgi:acetyl-CoA carboxylase carboxyl transferase subunit alpha